MAYVPGMPTNIDKKAREKAEKAYQKQQEKKKSGGSGSSSSSKPSTAIPANLAKVDYQTNRARNPVHQTTSVPTSVPQSVRTQAQISYNTQQEQRQQQQQQSTSHPEYNQGTTTGQSFVNSLPSKASLINSTVGADPSKILNTREIIKANSNMQNITFQQFVDNDRRGSLADKLPTDVRAKIYANIQSRNGRLGNLTTIEKSVLKSYRAIQPQDTTFEDMVDSVNTDRTPIACKYATAIDWTRMNKEGYRTILVESGSGKLQSKEGIYTIGRERLADVPVGCKTIYVDKNNNWYYIANTSDRSDFVKTMEDEREAKCGDILNKYNKFASDAKANSDKLVLLDSLIKSALEKANKTRKQEDIDQYYAYLEQRKQAYDDMKVAQSVAGTFIRDYAKTYSKYDDAISEKMGWTVEDEEQYQALRQHLRLMTKSYKENDPEYTTKFSAFSALSKRRMASGDAPVYMSSDFISKLDENTANMQRIVDNYNKWDSVMLHMEDGEGIGTRLKTVLLEGTNLNTYLSKESVGKFLEDWAMLGDSTLKALGLGGGDAIEKAYNQYGFSMEGLKDYLSRGYIGLTVTEYNKAKDAYTSGDINYAEFIGQEKYISNQLKSAMFNNVLTNLDIFNIASVEREYVAYKMALHPERYSNDPKFRQLQDSFKQIYGTDYNGAMDAWRMAYTAFQMDAGALDDYVYIDSSDLRNADGENYGIIRSTLIGTLTDIGTLISLGEKGLSKIVAKKGSGALSDAATEVLEYSLKTSGKNITDAEAKAIAMRYAKELRGASRKAVWNAFHKGDDLVEAYVDLQSKRFTRLLGTDKELVLKGLEESEKMAFYRTSRTLLEASADNIVEKSLLLSKGTVVTSALRNTAEMVDDFQAALFKATCPVVGAVTGLAKIYKGTQALINQHIAKEYIDDATRFMTATEKQALAKITEMQFDDVFDAGLVQARMRNIQSTLAEAALSTNDSFRAIAEQLMTGHSDNIMRMAANSYTNHIIGTFMDNLVVENGVYSLKELEKFALTSGFETFDEMYSIVRKNLWDTMGEYSTDARAIIRNFDAEYNYAVNIAKVNKYAKTEDLLTTHLTAIENFFGDQTNSLLSVRGVVENPMLLQSASLDLADSIYNFAYSMNPDWATFIDAMGDNSTIHLAAQNAIDALDVVATGNFGAQEIYNAQEALSVYTRQLIDVYQKNFTEAYNNAVYDVLGKTGYLDRVKQEVATGMPQDDTILRHACDKLSDNIKAMGYTVSSDDLYNNVFKDAKELKDLNLQQIDTIYRVMRDKVSNTIAQINDPHFVELTKAICNPDNPANKTLTMYASDLEQRALFSGDAALEEQARNIRTAISNSSAVMTTRIFSDGILKEGMDTVLYTGIMDSWTGNAALINRILEQYPHDQAVTKITKLIVDDTQKQLALHSGTYPNLLEYGANTVDVTQNVRTLDKILTDNGFKSDAEHVDICFSILSTTDSGAPKDIAFYVRGSEEAPFTLRQDLPFDITDGEFSAKHYGCSPVNARNAYANLGYHPTVTRDEFQQQLRDYITQQKDLALADNKSIRFIGFNSADGISDGNKYLNDIIRSTGTSINTANAIDYADILRSNLGEYIIDGDTVANIRTAVSQSMRKAQTNSITLGLSPAIAYDSRYTCAELLDGITDNIPENLSAYKDGLQYIEGLTHNVKGQLGQQAFETMGAALGMYIDSQALERLLIDAGAAPQRMQQLIMSSVRDLLGKNSTDQVALHKIFDQSFVGTWFDTTQIKKVYGSIDEHLDYMHTQTQRINQIYNSIKRTDLIVDSPAFKTAYNILLEKLPNNNRLCQIARAININNLTPTEMYAAMSWLYDEVAKITAPDELFDLRTVLLAGDDTLKDGMCSAILPEGRAVICGSLVDFTDELLDPLAVKWLDTSEDGYKFAYALDEMQKHEAMFNNIKEYNDTLNAVYAMDGVYGTQDKLLRMQSAAVYDPIIDYQKDLKRIYDEAYNRAYAELPEGFDKALADKYATQKAVAKYNRTIKEFGEESRHAAVQAVLNLDSAGMRAHLIRNCGGGLVIDPAAKCMEGVDILPVFQKWRDDFGLTIEEFKYSDDIIKERTLYRVIAPEVDSMTADELYTAYNHAHIDFINTTTERFSSMRNMSFGASDMSLMDGAHMNAIRDTFFDGAHIIDLDTRFQDWKNELYMCNMWTDSDLKQIINPYYSDDPLRSLAQSTHQVRKNIEALHDLGTVMNNPRMTTRNILSNIGYNVDSNLTKQELKAIKTDLKNNGYRMCSIVQTGNKFRLIDFTDVVSMKNYETVFNHTICIDNGTYRILSDWNKATSMAVKFADGGAVYKKMAHAYKLYKDTIRNHQITWYLYGNIGTAVRNMVDSSIKGFNETLQYGESPMEFVRNYVKAVSDQAEYTNLYRNIEVEHGVVDHETILKYFSGNEEGLRKFNMLYGYCNTSGADDLVSITRETAIRDTLDYLKEGAPYGDDVADIIRKEFDAVYASPKYRMLNSAEKAQHLQEIYDACMKRIVNRFDKASDELLETISNKFWNYNPTVQSWGDIAKEHNKVLQLNQKIFEDAETRARLALYETFMNAGETEAEAMEHVIATQFDYAGIGHVEDFMPFTQYGIYNALYWFDHADVNAIKNAWRIAQYNGDGAMTNQEIATMCSKYVTNQYYLYEKGADEEYDRFVATNTETIKHLLTDGVDSYLGLPREFQAGAYDLNGTHYIKLGNSFVEETDLVVSLAAGAVMLANTTRLLPDANGAAENIRYAYDCIRYTPLYDRLYSPWKAFMDFTAYAYDAYNADKNKAVEFKRPFDLWSYYNDFVQDKSTHSLALGGIPLVGAIAANVVGRVKSFNLNLGELCTLMADPTAQQDLKGFLWDALCDFTGMIMPSLVGTKIDPDKIKVQKGTNGYVQYLNSVFAVDPTNYIDYMGRLQKMGFTKEDAEDILGFAQEMRDRFKTYGSNLDYLYAAQDLLGRGYTVDEVYNLFSQLQIKLPGEDKFLGMYNALPGYLKYDAGMRNQIISYYMALGMSKTEAWAKMLSNPCLVQHGKLIELSPAQVAVYNKKQRDAYYAIEKNYQFIPRTDAEWKAYWDSMPFRYPKGEWKEAMAYLRSAGYSYAQALKMCQAGFMLHNGKLVDVQGHARARIYSYSGLKGAEWDAYWATVPDYTKYEKGAFGRTMKALKKMGYTDAQARALIQQGIYVGKDGKMMNVTGMQRPVLGYPNFNAYYQTIPEYCRYEKGAFKRTYAALKQLGFSYDMSLTLIQQGAYLMDASMIPSITQTLGARRQKDGSGVPVTNITTLILRYGGQIIKGADGKNYMLIDCSGLTRPRKSFGYTRRGYGGYGGRGGRGYGRGGRRWTNYTRKPKVKYNNFYLRQPFVHGNNVSSYNGFTNFRGKAPGKITKPYVTKGYVSTYSLQNFLNGASYGMRKVYKIDMRQYKSGALSTKSAYPAAYRNIAVSYRRNLYKDLYAKYGASRMQMRANQAGYSNASIVRLRRNEIQNRERYAERRDRKAEEKVRTRATR